MPRPRDSERHSPIGDLLAVARTSLGLTQHGLAARLNRRQSFVAKIETGAREVEVREFLWIVRRMGGDPIRLLSKLLKEGDDFRDLENPSPKAIPAIHHWNPGVDSWDDYTDVLDIEDDDDGTTLGNWRAPTA